MTTYSDDYFIDTIYDDKFKETYYYVVHQHGNGNRDIVSRYFRSYSSAQELMNELKDDLFSGEGIA